MKLGTCALLVATFAGCGDGSTLPSEVGVAGDGGLAAVLDFVRADNDLPSLAAALVSGDEVIEMAAVGVRAAGFSDAVTIDDKWHIGSLTKAMTGTLAAVLVEKGIVSWSTTVQDVFPDLVGSIRAEYEDVRLDELLYHTAGLPVDISLVPIWSTLRTDTRSLIVQRRQYAAELLELEPEAQRGTHLYTNAGYIVTGAMLEEITGEQWEDLMQRELFAPLGMTSTSFGAPGTPDVLDQPRGHRRSGNAWVPLTPGPDADNPGALGPAGTVHTTLDDYARYMIAHLAGTRGGDGLVTATSFTILHTAAPGTDYALGWGTAERDWARGRVIQHAGSNTLWYAVVWIAPERNLAMFAATNAAGDQGQRGTDSAILALLERFDAAFP